MIPKCLSLKQSVPFQNGSWSFPNTADTGKVSSSTLAHHVEGITFRVKFHTEFAVYDNHWLFCSSYLRLPALSRLTLHSWRKVPSQRAGVSIPDWLVCFPALFSVSSIFCVFLFTPLCPSLFPALLSFLFTKLLFSSYRFWIPGPREARDILSAFTPPFYPSNFVILKDYVKYGEIKGMKHINSGVKLLQDLSIPEGLNTNKNHWVWWKMCQFGVRLQPCSH